MALDVLDGLLILLIFLAYFVGKLRGMNVARRLLRKGDSTEAAE